MSTMSQQENETNKHLARFYAAISSGISDKKYKIIRNILKHNNCLNSLIPETPYFRQEKPHLIGNSLLHLALMEHEQKIFNFLIDQGADFTLKNSNGETVLHQAFRQSNKSQKPCDIIWGKIIHPFIDSGLTAQVNSRNWSNPSNKHGLTHFHIACMVNHTAAVKFFLENDVSVNETVDMDSPSLPGYSALQFAVRYYAYEVVLILLNYGADTSLKDASGTNPLQLVVKRNIDIAEWLQSGNHTLDKLFKKELEANEKVIAAILGPPGFDDTGSLGFNALHAACTLSDSSTVEELLRLDYDPEQAVDVRSPIFPGYRPLHFAAHFNTRTIKLLLDAGADPTREDATGRSALDICMTRDDVSDSMPMLLSSRPDWANISFSDGVTSLQKFVLSTRLCLSLLSFLEHVDIDVHLPLDSPLWPGCGVLHLCVLFAANEDNVPDIRTSIDLPNINCWLSPNGPLWIEHCLRHGADIYAPDARGLSPLQLAFRLGKHYLITYLLHTQPCFQADPGMSRLLLGCLYGDAKFVTELLRQTNGADCASRLDQDVKLGRGEDHIFASGSTPLHIAMARGCGQMVRALLDFDADYGLQDDNGLTPVHRLLGVNRQDEDLVSVLLAFYKMWCVDIGLSPLADCGLTYLHVATYWDCLFVVKKLLDRGCDVNATIACRPRNVQAKGSIDSMAFLKRYDGYNSLHLAIESKSSIAITLVEHGADILARHPNGLAPLYSILKCESNDSELMDCFVKALLRDPLLQESLLYESGLTMLHVACACSNMDLIEDLCDQGLDVNARAYQTSPIFPGCTPLHVLIIKFKNNISHISEMIYMLINHGTDVTIASAEQKTPVHELFDCFVAQGYELVSLLLRNQKDYSKNPVTVQGISHFHIACLYKEETVVAEFLKHGVDIHLPIDYFCEIYGGLTPLHLASMQHFKDIAFFLRKREIDVRSVTSFILSTRHESWHSTIHAYKETVNLLLRHGADLNIKDKFDNTPLHVAAMSNLPQKDVFHSLIRAGAPTESENVMGETPIQVLLSSTGPNILVSVFFTVTKNNANKAHL